MPIFPKQTQRKKSFVVRGLAAVGDWIITGFYLLAAKFMRANPKLAKPVVYRVLVVYYLCKEWYDSCRSALHTAGVLCVHALCALGIPYALLVLSQAITAQSIPNARQWVEIHSEPAFYAILFLAAALLCFRTILHSYALGTLLAGGMFLFVTLVSYYKTMINGFPLMLSDFSLLYGFGDIASYAMPKVSFSHTTVTCLIWFAVLFIAAICFDRGLRYRPRCAFAAMALALPLVLSALGGGFYSAKAAELHTDLATQEERIDRCGVVYGLYGAYVTSKNADYSSYSSDNLNRLQNTLYRTNLTVENETSEGEVVKPHVLMVLSESFFDITAMPHLHFAEDPLPNYHALIEKCTSGRFLSSTHAGGTGYVEIEALTGFSNYFIKESDTLTTLPRDRRDVYAAMPSVARELRDANGYDTYFIHSHNATLYDRTETMPSLGFNHVIFSDDFETPIDFQGFYVSDETLVNEVEYQFERREEGKPVFMQISTMENHQPYTRWKYPYTEPMPFTCDVEMTREEFGSIQGLVTGLHNADAALGRMVKYFEDCGEPVIIAFYGDHLPAMHLNDKDSLYSALKIVPSIDSLSWSSEELKQMLSTDYLIWSNYEPEESIVPDRDESSILIGADLLRRTGLRCSAYFRWLSDSASQTYLLSRPRLFVAADGTPSSGIPEDCLQTLVDHQMMEYDVVYGDNVLERYYSTSVATDVHEAKP